MIIIIKFVTNVYTDTQDTHVHNMLQENVRDWDE